MVDIYDRLELDLETNWPLPLGSKQLDGVALLSTKSTSYPLLALNPVIARI